MKEGDRGSSGCLFTAGKRNYVGDGGGGEVVVVMVRAQARRGWWWWCEGEGWNW